MRGSQDLLSCCERTLLSSLWHFKRRMIIKSTGLVKVDKHSLTCFDLARSSRGSIWHSQGRRETRTCNSDPRSNSTPSRNKRSKQRKMRIVKRRRVAHLTTCSPICNAWSSSRTKTRQPTATTRLARRKTNSFSCPCGNFTITPSMISWTEQFFPCSRNRCRILPILNSSRQKAWSNLSPFSCLTAHPMEKSNSKSRQMIAGDHQFP